MAHIISDGVAPHQIARFFLSRLLAFWRTLPPALSRRERGRNPGKSGPTWRHQETKGNRKELKSGQPQGLPQQMEYGSRVWDRSGALSLFPDQGYPALVTGQEQGFISPMRLQSRIRFAPLTYRIMRFCNSGSVGVGFSGRPGAFLDLCRRRVSIKLHPSFSFPVLSWSPRLITSCSCQYANPHRSAMTVPERVLQSSLQPGLQGARTKKCDGSVSWHHL